MISSKLLTNYILAPTWARVFIFLCFYFTILFISTNDIVFCVDDDVVVYKKKTMVLIEHDRIREYEDTIKAQELMIKVQDQMIKDEQNANKTVKTIVGIEILLLGLCFLSALSALFR